jgi:hypothetical protein
VRTGNAWGSATTVCAADGELASPSVPAVYLALSHSGNPGGNDARVSQGGVGALTGSGSVVVEVIDAVAAHISLLSTVFGE